MRKMKKIQKSMKASKGTIRPKTKKAGTKKAIKAAKVKSAPKKVQKKSVRPKSAPLKQAKPKKKTVVRGAKHSPKKTKNSPKRITAPTKSKNPGKKQPTLTNLYQNDLKNLSNGFWGNLDLLCFQQIKLKDVTADIVYASDDVGVVVKVLSQPGTWQVNTTTDSCKNGKTLLESPIAELKKLCSLIKESEPESKLIPTIILMRGTIKNEAEIQTYLKKKGVRLVRPDTFTQSKLPVLSQLLQANFPPAITSIGTNEIWDEEEVSLIAEPVTRVKSRKHLLTQKQTQKLASYIATVAHAGYFPAGSGTIGSLIALPIAYVLNQTNLIAMWISILLAMWIGVWAIQKFTENKVEKDPSSVIIDEVVGQSIAFALVAPGLLHWPVLLIGFILFRFFDICKFGLVKYFDKQKNAWGVMMDDVIAGLQTTFILVLLQILYILT